jgi:lipopolysaccharide assembly outer membrane protein LptD (OstA)
LLHTILWATGLVGWITPALAQDTLQTSPRVVTDSTQLVVDSLRAKAQFDAPVAYEAADSVVFELKQERLLLYKQGVLKYQSMEMNADRVRMDMGLKQMAATGVADSLGQLSGTPVFKEDGQTYNAEAVRYNYQTGKGRVTYAQTQMNEQQVMGPVARRNPDNTFFVKDGHFTTCDHAHPHFFIASKKLKMIPEDRIVSGPLYLAIGDVPLPIIIPFGFFPMQKSRASGLIFPEFGEALDRGFFLRNLGFYWATNEHMDLTLSGDIYSKGGWRTRALTNYLKHYKYRGLFSLEYSLIQVNFPEDEGFTNSAFNFRQERNVFVQWEHNQTISPQSSLRSSVHAGSSNALRRNGLGTDILRSDLRSSIAYQTAFPRLGANLTLNLGHQQNLNYTQVPEYENPVRLMTLTLPDIAFNKDRIYPFKNPNRGGTPRWQDKIGLTYNTVLRNRIRVADSLLFSPQAFDNMDNGMLHTATLNTNLKFLQFITATPSFSYREFWYLEEVQKAYVPSNRNPELDSLVTQRLQNGFHTGRDFNVSLNASTTIYGTTGEWGKRGTRLRHSMIPSISYTYRPDFSEANWGFYQTARSADSLARTTEYSRFEGFLLGGPSAGEQQSIGFQVQNIWEMKYFSKFAKVDSTTGKRKATYLRLVDNLGFSGNYNLAADSLRLSLLTSELRSNIANNRINLNLRAVHDPYGYAPPDSAAQRFNPYRINTLQVAQDGRPARLINASFALGTSFRSARKTKSLVTPPTNLPPGMQNPDATTADQETRTPERAPRKSTPFQQAYDRYYTPSAMEWSLNANYTVSYDRPFGTDTEALRHSLNLSGSYKFTPKWELRFNTNYDLQNKQFAFTTVDITRDLHCWQMSMNWIPFGIRRSYFITINVKSTALQDLKVTKRRDWRDTFIDF